MSADHPFYLAINEGVSVAKPEDDLLHTEQNRGIEGDSLTETQYFGFNVPEHDIHAMGYIWHHPNLGVVTGGLMAWQGIKRYSVAAELFDIRAYLSDAVLKNDMHDVQLENSYRTRVLEPMKRFQMTYNDEARGNHVDVQFEAVTPGVMFGDGKHLEQGLRTKGALVLRGKEYAVNGYNVRDRSWGKLRPENVMGIPPVAWMTGWFGDDFIFNCNLMDHAGSSPLSTDKFALPLEHALNGGWVARDGKLKRIVKAHKTVDRDPDTFLARRINLQVTTEDDQELSITGRLIAACPWHTWPNMVANICLIRWECEGRVGHGDSQDVIWNDFAHAWQPKRY
ncbi:MAG: hypothetical protein ABWZ40_11870 [Caulobacterales bacterium]